MEEKHFHSTANSRTNWGQEPNKIRISDSLEYSENYNSKYKAALIAMNTETRGRVCANKIISEELPRIVHAVPNVDESRRKFLTNIRVKILRVENFEKIFLPTFHRRRRLRNTILNLESPVSFSPLIGDRRPLKPQSRYPVVRALRQRKDFRHSWQHFPFFFRGSVEVYVAMHKVVLGCLGRKRSDTRVADTRNRLIIHRRIRTLCELWTYTKIQVKY